MLTKHTEFFEASSDKKVNYLHSKFRFVRRNDNRVRDYKARGQFGAIWRSFVDARSINQMSSTNKYDKNDSCLFVDYLGASSKYTWTLLRYKNVLHNINSLISIYKFVLPVVFRDEPRITDSEVIGSRESILFTDTSSSYIIHLIAFSLQLLLFILVLRFPV